MAGWLGNLAGFLPGADQMSEQERTALLRQGLLAAGLGILKNNTGGNASASVGAGLSEGLLALNNGADNLADRRYREQYMAQQMGAPTQFRAYDMMAQAAGHKPGTPGYQDYFKRINGELARQSSAAIQYRVEKGEDGVPRLIALDPRDVGAQVVGGNAAAGSYIDPRLPPEVQAAIRESEATGQPLPPHIDLAPAIPRQSQTAGINPFRGRRPEDEAAAIAAAQKAVELGALPTELGMRTNAAINQAEGQARATAGVEREQADRLKASALAQYEAAREGLVTGLQGTETGPVAGRLPAVTEGQQIAEGGVAAMAPVLKQLFRSAGEGVFTDRDQALLMEMLPTRKDHPEAARAKLANIDAIVKAKLSAGGGQPPNPAGAAAPGRVKRFNPVTGKIE